MLTFEDFIDSKEVLEVITEDFKSSSIIKIKTKTSEINVSYDTIDLTGFKFKPYISSFVKGASILRGVIFHTKTKTFNLCWTELLTHQKIISFLNTSPTFQPLKLMLNYNTTRMLEAGDKVGPEWCFTYEYVGGKISSTFEEEPLLELEKQIKISKILGIPKQDWERSNESLLTKRSY